nr:ATP-binding protein [Arcobacter peruensis]
MPKFKTQDIELIKDIEDTQIKSLENEVIQILINLLNNARDELIKYKQRRLIFIKAKKENDSLILEIKDNAKGIDKEIKDKIFDAYFTTKESNEGTGLGLYMCKDILDKLFDANIKVENETYAYENEEYTGAKFTIQIKL